MIGETPDSSMTIGVLNDWQNVSRLELQDIGALCLTELADTRGAANNNEALKGQPAYLPRPPSS